MTLGEKLAAARLGQWHTMNVTSSSANLPCTVRKPRVRCALSFSSYI